MCVVLFLCRLGPARAEAGLGFAMVGWFRRFCLPPGPLVLFRFRRPPLFFFLALSGFAPSRPGVLVLVFALCIPLIFHFIFMFISLSSLFSSSPSPHFQDLTLP